jgi:hypothetical protein
MRFILLLALCLVICGTLGFVVVGFADIHVEQVAVVKDISEQHF